MAIDDILLELTSYPDPSPQRVIETAADWAVLFEARLSALSFEVRFPRRVDPLTERLTHLSADIDEAHAGIAATAGRLLDAFEKAAEARGAFGERLSERCQFFEIGEALTEHARMRDLTIVSIPEGPSAKDELAERVIFGSGRPCLVLPEAGVPVPALGVVAVAWDFSRAAARAVFDALPVLRKAPTVRLLTVQGEKDIRTRRTSIDLARYLARHGVEDVTIDEVEAEGRPIAVVLGIYVENRGVDMLVMGAYGHSRLREFVLGGATRGILRSPPTAVFFSH